MTELKQYTRAEVASSDVKTNTLIIIYDIVYDAHEFLNEHPGGEEILLEHRAKDATEDFDDVGHSTDTLDLMRKYRVGELVEHEKTNVPTKARWVACYKSNEPEKCFSDMGYRFIYLSLVPPVS